MSGGRTGAFEATRWLVALTIASSWAALAPLGCGGDAFTAAGADGGPGEASVPIPEAGALDGESLDGATDAGLVDAGAGWCATQGSTHTFCEDFLHGVPDQLVELALNGLIAPDTSDYVSAPESMAASSPVLAKGASATAFASRDFSKAAGTQIAVSAYFKVASACFATGGSQNPNAASILAVNFPESNYELVVAVLPTSVELVEVTTDADGGNMKVQPQSVQATGLVGSWQDWTLTINGSAPKSATLTVGQATLFDKQKLPSAPVLGFLQHPAVYFGLAEKNDGGDMAPACKVGVDDILVDVRAVAVPN